jgi:hypothetical protein
MLQWHKNLTEKFRNKLEFSHYQLYWISFFKGLLVGGIIVFLYLR